MQKFELLVTAYSEIVSDYTKLENFVDYLGFLNVKINHKHYLKFQKCSKL